jgi:CRP/FNR family transcriptional regulator, cyclic AMP receptor protein
MVSNEFIKSIPGLDEYFSGLSSDFLDKMHVKIIPPNVTFVKKNNKAQYVYILCRGKVEVVNQFTKGDFFKFSTLSPIGFSGDIEVLSGNDLFSCSNTTITECMFVIVPKTVFIRCFEQDHKFSQSVGIMLAKKFYPRSCLSGQHIVYPLKYNLINFLTNHFTNNIASKKVVIIDKTRQEMADWLGVNIRSVNRTVNNLKEQNLISISKGKVVITKENYAKLISENNKFLLS